MRIIAYIFFLFYFIFTIGCSDDKTVSKDIESESLFNMVKSTISGIDFINDIEENPDNNLGNFDYFYNGGGVAIADFNNDGLSDIFFSGNSVSNRLFLNLGNLKFKDITESAGLISSKWSNGVSIVDINDDGYFDIYICNGGPSENESQFTNDLYLNSGDLTFKNVSKQYGIDDSGRSVQASFVDFDLDGDLDLWINNHMKRIFNQKPGSINSGLNSQSQEMEIERAKLRLYRNEGSYFTDISKEAKIDRISYGLGLAIADFNQDGWPDVYCANDYFLPDYYFINNRQGQFIEAANSLMGHISYYSMGCDASDFNNDGVLDLAVVDMTPGDHVRNKLLMSSMNTGLFRKLTDTFDMQEQYMFNSFQMGAGFGFFNEISHQLNLAQTDWSWSALLADFDNDGYKDYFITNGFLRDTKNNDWVQKVKRVQDSLGNQYNSHNYFDLLMETTSQPIQNYLFKNIKGEKFEDVSKNWGFTEKTFSNGAAYGDLDNDGDLDIVINNLQQKALLYENQLVDESSSYLRLELVDNKLTSKVLSSEVYAYCGDEIIRVDNRFVRGFQSFMEPVIHIGIGEGRLVDSLRIKWIDGTESIIQNLSLNKKHVIDKSAIASEPQKQIQYFTPFVDVTDRIRGLQIKHVENYFDDFNEEKLLPHKYSSLGPALVVGDVNQDELEDFYIGGAAGSAGQLILQGADQFVQLVSQSLIEDKDYEDLGALLVDVDGDNDLDLYVASGGGGEMRNKPNLLQDRLYINTGSNFIRSQNQLPKINSSTKAIAPYDFDNDGDLDLFVGARNKPGEYPTSSKSYFLRNQAGVFEDITSTIFNISEIPGMITDIEFVDLYNDGIAEIILTAEWSPPVIFEWKDDRYFKINHKNFDKLRGWWQSIETNDFDNDGDIDIVLGNIGLNNKFHPSIEKPLGVLANDFDQNGSLDIVLTKKYNGETVPVRGKECSSEQMPFIRDKFPLYEDFALSSVDDILGKKNINSSIQLSANNFASVLLLNNGSDFTIEQLPFESQSSPILDMVSGDFNQDGITDLVLCGRMDNTEPETPAYDGSRGLLLVGNGDATFKTSPLISYSGLHFTGNTKQMESIKLGRDRLGLLIGNNSGNIQIFMHKPENINSN